MKRFDVCVRGAGIVGRSLALALARQGLRVALQEAPRGQAPRGEDVRAYALNAASVELLQTLRVWDGLPRGQRDAGATTCTCRAMRTARASTSRPGTQRVRELAWIVDAAALEAELARRCATRRT